MWKAIDLNKIDGLLEEYKKFKNKGESFSEFIELSGLIEDDGTKIPDWDWVDSIGVVTPKDFENDFKKEFIEEHFEDLAHSWFEGINGQVDFSIVLECIKEELKEDE